MEKIVSIDTNVLVRFLTQDDPAQFEVARTIISENAIFVSDTVILETEWVLRFAYNFEPPKIIAALRLFLGLENVSSENPVKIEMAIMWHQNGLDFADAMHLASCQHTAAFATFDKALSKANPTNSTCELRLLGS